MATRQKKAKTDAAESGTLSPKQRKELKAAAESVIDQYLTLLGCPDPAKFTDEDGWRRIVKGSAKGMASIQEVEGSLYVRAMMEVMPLPSDKELILPLMRELLELNLNVAGSFRLGISGDTVFAGVTRDVTELDANDLVLQLDAVAAFADAVDDDLKTKYQGTKLERGVAS